MSNLQSNPDGNFEQEISLRDVIDFLKKSWKTITKFGFLGLICGIVYIWITPNEYQATFQIEMAQYIQLKDKSNNSISPVGANVEDPGRLIIRLLSPTTYNDGVVEACGFKNVENQREKIVSIVKATIAKRSPSIVEISIKQSSKELALACSTAIFEEIRFSQEAMMAPFFDEVRKSLRDNLEQIAIAKTVFKESAGSSSLLLAPSYLLARDEINQLTEKNVLLEYLLQFNEVRKTKLVAPIYLSVGPVYPKRFSSILGGLLGGLFVGVIFSLLKRLIQA